MNDSDKAAAYTCRFCHIKKSKNFNGYGFNLVSKSNKKCQQIGIVDENSPAQLAGFVITTLKNF